MKLNFLYNCQRLWQMGVSRGLPQVVHRPHVGVGQLRSLHNIKDIVDDANNPLVVARRSLVLRRPDNRYFHNWQDLVNFFSKNGDTTSVKACVNFAITKGEAVHVPVITNPPLREEHLFTDGDFTLPSGYMERQQKIYDTATWCVDKGRLDHELFHHWDELAQYFKKFDDVKRAEMATIFARIAVITRDDSFMKRD